jgi:anti-sigma28 factor (negative regulator of flagellin synthesis)
MVPITEPKPRDARAHEDGSTTPPRDDSSIVDISDIASAAATSGPSSGITARIARIRELLVRGEYPVDLDMLAERIVDDEASRNRG